MWSISLFVRSLNYEEWEWYPRYGRTGVTMTKDFVVTLRLTEEELKKLDLHTANQLLTRSQLLRLLVRSFIGLSEKEQREFVMKQLYAK